MDKHAFKPFVLFEYEHEPGTFCLLLSDNWMVHVIDVFEDRGQEGNGYSWEGVARQAVRAHAPELDGRFEFDAEAGSFVAHGTDRAALEHLAALLLRAWQNHPFLGELIDGADPEWMD